RRFARFAGRFLGRVCGCACRFFGRLGGFARRLFGRLGRLAGGFLRSVGRFVSGLLGGFGGLLRDFLSLLARFRGGGLRLLRGFLGLLLQRVGRGLRILAAAGERKYGGRDDCKHAFGHGSSPFVIDATILRCLRNQLAQHIRQYASALIVVDFDRRIDAQQERHLLRRAVLAMNGERDIHLRLDT